jgi:hypothetical protein
MVPHEMSAHYLWTCRTRCDEIISKAPASSTNLKALSARWLDVKWLCCLICMHSASIALALSAARYDALFRLI